MQSPTYPCEDKGTIPLPHEQILSSGWQAQKALSFHGRPFEGGSIVVRLAHAGKKGEKGRNTEGPQL